MIVEFTVGNFLSFYEKRTLSFEAKGISELKDNVINYKKHKLLRSAVVYGANSSGKSNLLKAFDIMRYLVYNSVKLNDEDRLTYLPFLLFDKNQNEPTFFEMVFLAGVNQYRYGFEYNNTEIINEWLWVGNNLKTQKPLFLRSPEGIAVTELFKEGKRKERVTAKNRLFLSVVAQLQGHISKMILGWFSGRYSAISGINHNVFKDYTNKMLSERLEGYVDVLKLFKTLKLGFNDLKTMKSDDLSVKLIVTHNKYDEKGRIVGEESWDTVWESEGTNKIIDLSGPIINALKYGWFLAIDELDTKMHPLITMHIVKLFNSPETNPNNAQLLFATHDTNLLNAGLFRRDQIWFTEKDELEQTDLYSLYDIELPDGTKVRNDSNLEKNYIRGRYGAIPFITN